MSVLEHAIAVAARAHAGYLAEDGEPYIFHPLRVMMALDDEDERIVGVLHDVPEKTAWSLDGLKAEGFLEHIIAAIDSVSRRQGEDYFDFVQRTRENDLGRRVKIADLQDNIENVKSRLDDPQARKKLDKYEEALRRLL
ncbi:HD domain-containing protein [Phyllobacterium bourgognense]|uniref:HD domain-containing protein n=1 Tax=Phyllobacterium bourgognense TaxID=314236 RepID=A0A368YUW1_9HYPH|nr:HD domain-containing protein [Phyllobacterium bourgognense]RCW82727.1 HD domain-containing protein [Phyllobacterium bourgognense]